MMKLLCRSCKKWKNVKKDNYERMLERFTIGRGILYGMSVGFKHLFFEPKRIKQELSKESMVEAFEKNYICRDCRNDKTKKIQTARKIHEILNLKSTKPIKY